MSFDLFGGGTRPFGSTNDNIELLKAWAGTSLAYALALIGGQILSLYNIFLSILLVSALTAGLGILLHELAHRIVARSYGARAHFIANDAWLVLSVVMAFTGFFIAAPGAVWHTGTRTLKQGGIIAAAGPLTNIGLALLFWAAAPLLPNQGIWSLTAEVGYTINAFLAFFNMIPFGPLDGAKVFAWNKLIWGVIFGVAFLMTFGDRLIGSLPF